MVNLSSLNLRRHSLQRRLFLTMLVLSMLLLGLFFIGFHLILGYTDTKQRIAKDLDFQLDIFARETTTYYKDLATMGILLSRESGDIVENYLADNHLAFDDLNDAQKHLVGIQKQLFDPLRHKLFEANCTGAFVMLQATVDTKSNHADASRAGLYLQRGTLDASDNNVLLYRGFSSIGRNKGYLPHRKWRLEFDTDLFPNYTDLLQHAKAPLTTNYCTTEIFTLPGTSEKAMLMVAPLLGSHGEVYGICGLEVSQSYFKQTFAQPSHLSRASFCLNKGKRELTKAEDCFSAGITDGYYSAPLGTFTTKPFGQGLALYESSTSEAYVGAAREVTIFPKNVDFTLNVLVPKQDYDYLAIQNMFRMISLLALFLLLAAALCIYFSATYLIPLKKSLREIQQNTYMATDSSIAEIDDLFVFLDEENRANEELLENMEKEKKLAEKALHEMQEECNIITQKIERLAYSRKNEIDPDDYENFKIGFKLLTKREKAILQLYIAGKSVREIIEEADIKESTVRFHNRNIYSKLGVHSRKQLLRCLAIMEQEKQDNTPNA